MFKIFQTYKNSDMTEGKGLMVPDAAFISQDLANDYIDKQPGIMGRRGKWSKERYGDWTVKPIIVYEQGVEIEKEAIENLKKTALAKLTKAEKEALGL